MTGDRETLHIGPPPHRRRSVIILAVCLVVVFGGLGWWRFGREHASSSAPPSHSPTPAPALPTTPRTPTPTPYRPQGDPPRASSVDLSWLHASSGWELFARTAVTGGALGGQGSVIRIQPGTGRVTTTAVPSLASSGPVEFAVRSHAAFVHPLDNVAAFVVPDGMPAGRSAGLVPDGGILLPGPAPDQVWTERDTQNGTTLVLVRLPADPDGQPVPLPGSKTSLPSSIAGFPFSDGAGGIMVPRASGTYRLRPGRTAMIIHGTVVATGPQAWVAARCTSGPSCRLTVVDPVSGARHPLGTLHSSVAEGGRTSPDGTIAALLVGADRRVVLVNRTDGKRLSTNVHGSGAGPAAILAQGTMAWSPDGSRLFVVDRHHRVMVIDPDTGHARPLGLHLRAEDGTVQQIAVRP